MTIVTIVGLCTEARIVSAEHTDSEAIIDTTTNAATGGKDESLGTKAGDAPKIQGASNI